jgi:hypothetical protein
LLPKFFWPSCEKKLFQWSRKLLKFEAEGRKFAKILRSLEQFVQTVKGQNKFLVKESFFYLFLEVSQIWYIRTIIIQIGKHYWVGFRNIHEKLKKNISIKRSCNRKKLKVLGLRLRFLEFAKHLCIKVTELKVYFKLGVVQNYEDKMRR